MARFFSYLHLQTAKIPTSSLPEEDNRPRGKPFFYHQSQQQLVNRPQKDFIMSRCDTNSNIGHGEEGRCPNKSYTTTGFQSPSPGGTSTTTTCVKRYKPGSYSKFLSIDVTSPLGQYILSKQRGGENQQATPPSSSVNSATTNLLPPTLCQKDVRRGPRSRMINNFPVTYPNNRSGSKKHHQHHQQHTYSFSPYDRWRRYIALETGRTN